MEGMTDVGSKIKYRPEFMKWEIRELRKKIIALQESGRPVD